MPRWVHIQKQNHRRVNRPLCFFFDLGPNFPLIACASALRINMKSGRGSDLLRVYRDERNSFHACTHSIAYT